MITRLKIGVLFISAILTAGCIENEIDESESVYSPVIDQLSSLPFEALSYDEIEGLIFMREEEKLARDIYREFYALWDSQIFDKISESEQTHTDTIGFLLERYSIADPTVDQPDGSYANWELQALYDLLSAQGSSSLVDALFVAAEIEEVDILDLQHYMEMVDNQDIKVAYDSLLRGSYNHLRAYVRNLDNQGIYYTPQHLSLEAYDAIINAL
ncbi:MAG: DUF2202 domain-containing protein [Gammaproteobacteria bacterium]|nr:DUF2202 domain-containing protein [Gammaproteobacteria bacterium]